MQWGMRWMQWMRRKLFIRTYDINKPDKEEIRGLNMNELLDVILNNQCSSCKEIHYLASKVDSGIGIATVYRMVNELEDIGVISRKIVYDRAMAV